MASQTTPSPRGRVLIVEDESGIRAAMALILEMAGFQVAQASDGRQGLHSIIECVPDVVISDYMMPYMNGIEMIRDIKSKEEFKSLPIILLTAAFPDDVDYEDLIDEIYIKPVDVATLIEAVQMLVDRRSSAM